MVRAGPWRPGVAPVQRGALAAVAPVAVRWLALLVGTVLGRLSADASAAALVVTAAEAVESAVVAVHQRPVAVVVAAVVAVVPTGPVQRMAVET